MYHGPDGFQGQWDPISHRDINPSNIFLRWEPQNRVLHPYPWWVRFTDWSCAVTDSEFEILGFIELLPTIDMDYAPPEDAQPAESTDVYQVGLVLSLMYTMKDEPTNGVKTVQILKKIR
jgi:serine/threonine protein kinase